MSDGFLGAWLVTEYVFDSEGALVGKVRQARRLESAAGERFRVVQVCTPEASLSGHPMERFAGEWVFEMSIVGRDRLYHGPDVVGIGTQWVDGVMTGRGMWPRFGHTFRSFSVMADPGRQLTGGTFSTGSALDASIAGVAVPDDGSGRFPELPAGDPWFPELEPPWLSRAFGPVQESEAWFAPDDHRQRLVIHDAVAAAATVIELRNQEAASVEVIPGS